MPTAHATLTLMSIVPADGRSVPGDRPAGSGGDEAQLATRALTGDRSAWDALFGRHNRRVLVALLAHGVRIEQAREIAQDAWIRLIEQQRAGRLVRLSLPGLAIAQALLLARDRARRAPNARHHVGLDDVSDAALAARSDDAVEQFCTRDQLARAVHLLTTLGPSAQRVFAIIYQSPGVEHAAVAREVGLSVQRVRQIIHEVRKKLRAAFEER
jgi:RNA polymerase sigma-70 factor (ECF subfamily)